MSKAKDFGIEVAKDVIVGAAVIGVGAGVSMIGNFIKEAKEIKAAKTKAIEEKAKELAEVGSNARQDRMNKKIDSLCAKRDKEFGKQVKKAVKEEKKQEKRKSKGK